MRVLHISGGNMYGGVETILVTLARYRHLCPEMQPSFAVCFEGRLSKELAALNVPVRMLGNVRTSRVWSVVRARRHLRKLLSEEPFDAVICHMCWAHAIFGPEAKRAGLPLIFWAHGVATGRHWLERWAGWTTPDAAVANSAFTAASVHNLFEGVPTHVVYCPVAMTEGQSVDRKAIRREIEAPEDAVVILQVSRMEPWKGHRLHLRALSKMRDEPAWICLMVGGAQRPEELEYVRALERQTEELGLIGRVRFLGQRSDVGSLMAAADLFCQPNQSPEPFGIVFIEALAAQLPVVTTALGGGIEIVTESCGFLVPPENPTALANCLRSLVVSPGLRLALGQAGPARARELCDPATQLGRLHQTLAAYTPAAVAVRS
jgi:glycosyltransferase involved in cell wall biosynthesis